MTRSYFGRVAVRCSRASSAFISLAATLTPSGYTPSRHPTVRWRPFQVIRRTHCRTTSRPFSHTPLHFFSNADQHRSIRLDLLEYGGEDTRRISKPDPSANCTIRFRNCVRRPEFFGPLARAITSRLTGPRSALTRRHHRGNASPQASLVARDPNRSSNAPRATLRMPKGTSFCFAGGS